MLRYLLFLLLPFQLLSQNRYQDRVYDAVDSSTYEYAVKDKESLKLDLYQPSGDTLSQRPVMVFIHGGGFSIGARDEAEMVRLSRNAAQRGYVVASISYRLTRKGKGFGCTTPSEDKIKAFKDAGEDLLDALCFLDDHQEDFKINMEQLILGGSSAGAEAMLSVAYNKELFFKGEEKYNSIKPAAVAGLAGAVLDIDLITEQNAVPGIFFHGTKDPLVPYGSASHHYCSDEKPGFLILHGSKTLAGRLKELDSSFFLYSVKDAGHDIFEITDKQLQLIFDFMHTVVIKGESLQSEVTE
ncbi:carboxylesterase family protein [Leptobacterium flavescens]|uniref:Carboxylesterase family protein n=1 Tax=Leptobacterium flavescens TaxID=472055 RepID=A0A6P0UN63_9FLAO|nr:alpha/beta hydrolase [Leptobacterium flavescens]NER12443.1 carboxylesterase family protein [Leptobacterium flavescens]